MDATQQGIWVRIEAFSIDEGGEQLTFAQRLARENGWSFAFAARVIDEYKKFAFLAKVAGGSVDRAAQAAGRVAAATAAAAGQAVVAVVAEADVAATDALASAGCVVANVSRRN